MLNAAPWELGQLYPYEFGKKFEPTRRTTFLPPNLSHAETRRKPKQNPIENGRTSQPQRGERGKPRAAPWGLAQHKIPALKGQNSNPKHPPPIASHQMSKGEGLSGKSAVIRAESTRQKNHVELSPIEDQNLLIENHGGPPSGIRLSHP